MIYRQCRDCGKTSVMPTVECEYCYSTVSFPEAASAAHSISVFESGYYRDIDYEPVYCKGRHDLQAETRGRGQVSPYAED